MKERGTEREAQKKRRIGPKQVTLVSRWPGIDLEVRDFKQWKQIRRLAQDIRRKQDGRRVRVTINEDGTIEAEIVIDGLERGKG